MVFNLGVLDFGFEPGGAFGRRLSDTIDVVEHADRLGFSRYWLGEHHCPGSTWSGSGELLLPLLAGRTDAIRVGIGAMILDYYAPLKVANDFRLLGNLFQNRIDLGLCRSRADLEGSHIALGGSAAQPGLFPEAEHEARVHALLAYLQGCSSGTETLAEVSLNPGQADPCQVWICGGSFAARLAAETGSALCLSHFHGGNPANPRAASEYRDRFRSESNSHPRLAIAVSGAVIEDPGRAKVIREEWRYPNYIPNLIGSTDEWSCLIDSIQECYSPDELLIMDVSASLEDRIRTLDLLTRIVSLPANPG